MADFNVPSSNEELLPVQRGESQPVYFDSSEAEKVHKGAKVFLKFIFQTYNTMISREIYETVDLVLLLNYIYSLYMYLPSRSTDSLIVSSKYN